MCLLNEMVVGIFGAAYKVAGCADAGGVGDLALAVAARGVGDLEVFGVGETAGLGDLLLGVRDLDFRTGVCLAGFLESSGLLVDRGEGC